LFPFIIVKAPFCIPEVVHHVQITFFISSLEHPIHKNHDTEVSFGIQLNMFSTPNYVDSSLENCSSCCPQTALKMPCLILSMADLILVTSYRATVSVK